MSDQLPLVSPACAVFNGRQHFYWPANERSAWLAADPDMTNPTGTARPVSCRQNVFDIRQGLLQDDGQTPV